MLIILYKYIRNKKKIKKFVYCKTYLQCCGFCKSWNFSAHNWKLVYFIGIKLISFSVQDLKQLICYANSLVRIAVFTFFKIIYVQHQWYELIFDTQQQNWYSCQIFEKLILWIIKWDYHCILYVNQIWFNVVGFFFYTVMYKTICFFLLGLLFQIPQQKLYCMLFVSSCIP